MLKLYFDSTSWLFSIIHNQIDEIRLSTSYPGWAPREYDMRMLCDRSDPLVAQREERNLGS